MSENEIAETFNVIVTASHDGGPEFVVNPASFVVTSGKSVVSLEDLLSTYRAHNVQSAMQ